MTLIDRTKFYDAARPIFGGTISQSQVDGINTILDQWEFRQPSDDLRWLAYMLATTKHETAHTMQPIKEYGLGAGHEYGQPDPVTGQTYYGRGFVQLTWKANYQTFADRIGVDLVNNPDLALDPAIATTILFDGMQHGLFTGVGLPKYFNPTTDDWLNARRIINGTDQAARIAGYGHAFHAALTP
jgi:putative chitinase